jgi:hypothetical protein
LDRKAIFENLGARTWSIVRPYRSNNSGLDIQPGEFCKATPTTYAQGKPHPNGSRAFRVFERLVEGSHQGALKYPLDQGRFEGDRIFDMPEATQAANLVSAFSDGDELGISSSLRRERFSN